MMSPEEEVETMDVIGELIIRAAKINLDSFLAVTHDVSSPQALAMGINPKAVTNAGDWHKWAELLYPFWLEARRKMEELR